MSPTAVLRAAGMTIGLAASLGLAHDDWASAGTAPAGPRQELLSPTLRRLVAALDADDGGIGRFWEDRARDGTPLVEVIDGAPTERLVTFLYRGPPDAHVRLASNLNVLLMEGFPDFDTLGQLRVIGGTDVRYLTLRVRHDLRIAYAFEVETGEGRANVLDPLGREVYLAGTRFEESSVALPGAPPQPWANLTETGEWHEHEIQSRALGSAQAFWVHVPAGAADDAAHPVVIGMDPVSFGQILPATRVLAHLESMGTIPPTILVAAPDLAWVGEEMGSYDPAVDFLADELLPMLREAYPVDAVPEAVVVAGLSRRGMLSAYAAFSRPDALGRALSLSGSFYWSPPDVEEPEWLPGLLASESRREIRIYLAAGELETVVTPNNGGHYMLATNRHMRDVLRAKGYEHRYAEFYGVHSTINWQDQLEPGLRYLLGRP